MTADLTKLVSHSSYSSFKNTRVYTGTLTISGTLVGGLNTRTWNITMNPSPELLDVYLSGPEDVGGRPTDALFRVGHGAIVTTVGGGAVGWQVSYRMTSATNLLIYAYASNLTNTPMAITSTNFNYKIVDYAAT